jgi:hypothetical protein
MPNTTDFLLGRGNIVITDLERNRKGTPLSLWDGWMMDHGRISPAAGQT